MPPPPWHYAGWLMNVAVRVDPARSDAVVPRELGRLTGNGCVHFADWQATSDGSELLDPVYAQYRETIVIVEIERPDGAQGPGEVTFRWRVGSAECPAGVYLDFPPFVIEAAPDRADLLAGLAEEVP